MHKQLKHQNKSMLCKYCAVTGYNILQSETIFSDTP